LKKALLFSLLAFLIVSPAVADTIFFGGGGGTCYPFIDQSSCASFTTLGTVCIDSTGALCLGNGSTCTSETSVCISASSVPSYTILATGSGQYLTATGGNPIQYTH
jgi:hypothetical protein